MSYPFGMPSFSTMPTMNYDMYNFNNLYQMMELWASQSKANAELWSKYMNLFPQPSAQSARQQNTAPQSQERPAAQQSQTPAASQATEQAAQPRQQIQQQPAQTQSQQQQQAQQPELDADDGKIGWKRKLKNFGKGMLNMAKGLFCDEKGFSLKRTLTTVAVAGAAAALTVATGGAAAPFLVAAGAAMGAFQTAKGAYKAATAKTDAEAEAAWQDIGAGTLSIGLSAAGAKGALKAAGKPVPASKGLTGSVKATADSFSVVKDGVKTLATNPKETLAPLVKAETWTNAGTKVANAAKETFSVKSAPKTTKEALGKAYDKDTAKLNKKANKLAKEISELKAKPETEALKLEIKQKTARLEKIYRDINRIKAEKAKIGAAPEESGLQATNRQNRHVNPQKAAAEARKAAVEKIESNIKDIETAMKDASPARKAVYKKQLNAEKRRLNETKKLNKAAEQLDIINNAKAKNTKLEAALEKLNKKINDVENGAMSDAEKAIELAKLNRHKGNIEKLITQNKTKAAIAKAALLKTNILNAYKNMPGYEKALTAGITGSLNNNSIEENTALADYQAAIEAYNQELLAQQQQAEEAAAQTAQEQPAQTQPETQPQQQASEQSQQTASQQNYQMPYMYNPLLTDTNPLGFNDLYVSPYPDMIF